MMPMNGMGEMMPSSESNIIQALNYSSMGLSEVDETALKNAVDSPQGLTLVTGPTGSGKETIAYNIHKKCI